MLGASFPVWASFRCLSITCGSHLHEEQFLIYNHSLLPKEHFFLPKVFHLFIFFIIKIVQLRMNCSKLCLAFLLCLLVIQQLSIKFLSYHVFILYWLSSNISWFTVLWSFISFQIGFYSKYSSFRSLVSRFSWSSSFSTLDPAFIGLILPVIRLLLKESHASTHHKLWNKSLFI